jgi:oligopeptide transport system substrate-binding protein
MRRIAAFALAALLLVPAACRKQPEGTIKVVVIGNRPQLREPSDGPLSMPDQVLLANVAQGLVRFDATGNIVGGLAERWTVSDDGLSYIFRIASANWPDGHKITADQVVRILKHELGNHSKNSLRDQLGSIQDIVAMTDRVIEINLIGPRPDLLSLLAQPQMAILRNGMGTGPFSASATPDGPIKLAREIVSPDEETTTREQLLLGGGGPRASVQAFAASDLDLVLGGTFADLPITQQVKLPRDSLRFDQASGLFGLVPAHSGGPLDKPEVRQLLSEAIDRDSFIAGLGVSGLVPRATLLEPGLEGVPAPAVPSFMATSYADRVAGLKAEANRLFPKAPKPTIRVYVPEGPGADMLFRLLERDWSQLGFTVARATLPIQSDLALIDEVAPSSSPSWFVRQFRCTAVAVCDPEADQLMDSARQSPVPAQRYALLAQAAARLDAGQLFIPITGPLRWSLVSERIQNFAGNRYARHSLTELEARLTNGD